MLIKYSFLRRSFQTLLALSRTEPEVLGQVFTDGAAFQTLLARSRTERRLNAHYLPWLRSRERGAVCAMTAALLIFVIKNAGVLAQEKKSGQRQ